METGSTSSESPWYVKFFEYWKNRNRVGPGRVELPDCDFFIVGPRRTLRILRPPLKSGWYYENTNERRESINDNFFTRWSRRPHSSGNCRCSFRQSNRVSTAEEQIISAELNRIRTSLCEAEKTGQDFKELEQKLAVDLQKLQVTVPENQIEQSKENDEPVPETGKDKIATDDNRIDEQSVKNKIVKDLERYINNLLEEILDDTVKFIAGAEDVEIRDARTVNKRSEESLRGSHRKRFKDTQDDVSAAGRSSSDEAVFTNINFSFHAEAGKTEGKDSDGRNVGYVNRAFIGSSNDPDSLEFYLRPSVATEANLEQLDCIDSGINSVETAEFQPEQETSLEQSLLRIIDEKFGRTAESSRRNSWEKPTIEGDDRASDATRGCPIEERTVARNARHPVDEKTEAGSESAAKRGELERRVQDATVPDISADNRDAKADSVELEDPVNEPSFEKLRLEFKDNGKEPSLKQSNASKSRTGKAMTKLREKLCTNLDESSKSLRSSLSKRSWNDKVAAAGVRRQSSPIELEDYRKKWPDLDEKSDPSEQSPRDLVMFRMNRKPTIVFLHGFGSSAEIFEHQLEYFSALGYPCIAPDMLGHGMSSAPGRRRDYHFEKLLKDLDAVLHHYAFRPGQKCVLVAHNYGCSFATALACKYDSNIHQLVLISGGGPTPLAPPSTESAGHWCLRAVLAPFLMCGLHRGILYSARGRQHPYCGPEPVEQWPSHMKYILDGMVWPEGDYVFHRRICTPTLLVHGLRDNKVSLVQECQMERTMMKAFLEALPAAGHSPMTDCPTQLNHMIHCFIDLWKKKKWQQ